MVKIVITGVPAVGKSTIAKALAKELNFDYISEKDLLEEGMYDELVIQGSLTKDVDITPFTKKVKAIKKDAVLDGLLFPEVNIKYDLIVVLYELESKLQERMKDRGYSEVKILDNIYAQRNNYLLNLSQKRSKNIVLMSRSTIKEDVSLINGWIKENHL